MENSDIEKTSIKASQIKTVEYWLEQVVIGLNLCPFAAKPYGDQQIRIEAFDGDTEVGLLEMLQSELTIIDKRPIDQRPIDERLIEETEAGIETTLIVIPDLLQDFNAYNQFLDLVDALLDEYSWTGQYQIASFHPQYCFAGVAPDSPENLTNRSPYPLLHIIREASIEMALQHYPDPENIPVRNIEKMNNLSAEDRQRLFPHLDVS